MKNIKTKNEVLKKKKNVVKALFAHLSRDKGSAVKTDQPSRSWNGNHKNLFKEKVVLTHLY